MEEQRTLTLDFVKSLMEPSYTLVWTDYNDNLDNHLDIIRKCLDRRNCDCLWEKAGEWYGDAEYEAVHGIMEKLKDLWATADTQKIAEGVLAFDYVWHEDLNKTVPGLAALVKKDLDLIQAKGMLEAVKTIL